MSSPHTTWPNASSTTMSINDFLPRLQLPPLFLRFLPSGAWLYSASEYPFTMHFRGAPHLLWRHASAWLFFRCDTTLIWRLTMHASLCILILSRPFWPLWLVVAIANR